MTIPREENPQSPEQRLDPRAKKAEQEVLSEFRDLLFMKACALSEDGILSEDDICQAYRQLRFPSPDALRFSDAQEVLSQAFRENKFIEWISYAMAIVFFVVGIMLLVYGSFSGEGASRLGAILGGSLVEVLILIPFRMAINSRKHNIALRMLGLILNRIDDPKKLAPLLKDTFFAVVLGKSLAEGEK